VSSKSHHDLLVKAINEYLENGYRLLMLNRSLTKSYRPDAVVENDEEIVIIEAVVTSDRTQNVGDIQHIFSKTIRIDKRRVKPKRTKVSMRREENKNKALGTAKLSTKGQVTIPVDARNKFNLETGDLMLFLEEDGKLVLRKG